MLRLVQDANTDQWEIVREFDDHRLEVLRLLHEACEIEHSLMLQYLYAAYSLRPSFADVMGSPGIPEVLEADPKPRDRISPGDERKGLLGVAVEEMIHLRDVNRIIVELGGSPNLTRQDFPYEPLIYPFSMKLEPLTRCSVAKYLYAEAPSGALDPAGENADLAEEVRQALASCEDTPSPAPMNHIGSLYRTVIKRLEQLADEGNHPEVPGWIQIVESIQREGEFDHFQFFVEVFEGRYAGMSGPEVWSDPELAQHPSEKRPKDPTALAGRTNTMAGDAGRLADIGNRAYWASLLILGHAYEQERRGGVDLPQSTLGLMTRVIDPVARLLAKESLGLPFDPLSLGYSPCNEPSENLRLAADFLDRGAALVDQLPTSWRHEIPEAAETMSQIADQVRNARRQTSPVAVIGSGPAGLAAALALTMRNVPVRVLERSNVVGGKVYSETVPDGNVRRSMEHGVHGWWPAYRNFHALLEYAGVDLEQAFVRAESTHLLYETGRIAELKPSSYSIPSPLFIMTQLANRAYLGGVRSVPSMLRFGFHLLAFRHEEDYDRYDRISLAAFMEQTGVPERVRNRLFKAFALNFGYLMPDQISAAAILSAMQFYILPAHDALLPYWTRGLPARQVFDPLVEAIERGSGRVERSVEVRSIATLDHAVTGIDYQVPARVGLSETEVVADVDPADVRSDDFLAVKTDDRGEVFIRKQGDGNYQVFGPICTHSGGRLCWRSEMRIFECQLHGGTFDESGAAKSRPPTEALPPQPKPTLRADGRLEIKLYRRTRRLPCHDAILATDVRAAEGILQETKGIPDALKSKMAQLEATPVLVVRMWFPAGTSITHGDLPTAVTPACELVDNYFHLNRFDRSYDAEGEVVEVQGARNSEAWLTEDDDQILGRVLEDLKRFELLKDDVPLPDHYVVLKHESVFTKYNPGAHPHRPPARTAVTGLYLAGDWTRADRSVWFMERAVVSGLRAANEVLTSRGLPPVRILPPEPEQISLVLFRTLARLVRGVADRLG